MLALTRSAPAGVTPTERANASPRASATLLERESGWHSRGSAMAPIWHSRGTAFQSTLSSSGNYILRAVFRDVAELDQQLGTSEGTPSRNARDLTESANRSAAGLERLVELTEEFPRDGCHLRRWLAFDRLDDAAAAHLHEP